jgi:DNA processing protein
MKTEITGLLSCSGIGVRSILKLLQRVAGGRVWQNTFLRDSSLWQLAYSASQQLLHTVWTSRQVAQFMAHRAAWNGVAYLEELSRKQVAVCTILDDDYPVSLLELTEPPLVLYIRGTYRPEMFELSRTFAIVGTRQISAYGTQVTAHLSKELALAGATIVSGLATGVDAQAHRSCIKAGGYTVAVLGTAIDTIYPAKNRTLYQQILTSGGCIISEYAPGTPPQKGMFVLRNRIIAGLSRAVIIPEATKQSGSLITAAETLELGRDVCAVPGSIFSSGSSGTHYLIQHGAKLINHSHDLILEYGLKPVRNNSNLKAQMSDTEQLILDILSAQLLTSDQLAEQVTVPIHELQAAISSLEIQALIQRHADGTLLRVL